MTLIQEPNDVVEVKLWEDWEQAPSNSFAYQVQSGRLGKNEGLPNGIKRLNKYTHGTQKGRIYVIGADSGVGKTTITDFLFVLQAYESAKKLGRTLKIIYYSFEISKIDKEARWVSYYIYKLFNKNIPSDYILGRIPGVLVTDEDMLLIQVAYKEVQELMKCIIFIEDSVHPTKIFEDLVENYYSKRGTVQRSKVSEAEIAKGKRGRVLGYTPDDPNLFTILVIDHLALLHTEMGLTLKGTMDKMSRYCVVLRNLFNCTSVLIQQFSTDLLQNKREQAKRDPSKGAVEVTPSRLDFGDSKAVYRDADVVFGAVKPLDFGIEMIDNWNAKHPFGADPGLGSYLILLYLMKNRYGASNKRSEQFLNPIAGFLYDLPYEYGEEEIWYERAIKLDKENGNYTPIGKD